MFESINWALIAPLLVIQLLLMIIALIDWVTIKHTRGPKWVWLLIIIFISTLGPIIYFLFGRKN